MSIRWSGSGIWGKRLKIAAAASIKPNATSQAAVRLIEIRYRTTAAGNANQCIARPLDRLPIRTAGRKKRTVRSERGFPPAPNGVIVGYLLDSARGLQRSRVGRAPSPARRPLPPRPAAGRGLPRGPGGPPHQPPAARMAE